MQQKGGDGMAEVKVIIGANFGDEGKGLMSDYFAAEAAAQGVKALVICSNGGAQRGHTVVTPRGERHVFHHFGSGTLAGADTWLPRYYILNPIMFMDEYEELIEIETKNGSALTKNEAGPKVYLDPDSPVTTPYDMIINQIAEQHRGDARHGSCGVGIWETLIRNGKTLGEMIDMTDTELLEYLTGTCRKYMYDRLKQLGVDEIPDRWKDIIEDEGLARNYIQDFRLMVNLSEIADISVMDKYERIIFENGQGLLLDRCRKEYGCNTTPSNTGLRNPADLIREYIHSTRENRIAEIEVCYITRTYLTRHGAGRFDEECDKAAINADMVDLTNVPNPYQGTIRYGKLEDRALLRRIREDFDSERFPDDLNVKRTIVLTHTNEYESGLTEFADYISDGETRQDIRRVS